jgi:hypothetical protein
MRPSADLEADREGIRTKLKKLAAAGKLTYYGVLGEAVGKHARWPLWTEVLDAISREKPDLTSLVLLANEGWPSRIGYQNTNGRPTRKQKELAQRQLDAVFKHYCPGKSAPRLPQRKRR